MLSSRSGIFKFRNNGCLATNRFLLSTRAIEMPLTIFPSSSKTTSELYLLPYPVDILRRPRFLCPHNRHQKVDLGSAALHGDAHQKNLEVVVDPRSPLRRRPSGWFHLGAERFHLRHSERCWFQSSLLTTHSNDIGPQRLPGQQTPPKEKYVILTLLPIILIISNH